MEQQKICPICSENQTKSSQYPDGIIHFECPRCQTFQLYEEAWEELQVKNLNSLQKAKLSGWIFEQNKLGSPPILKEEFIGSVDNIQLPSIAERCLGLLEQGIKMAPKYGSFFEIKNPILMAATYSETEQDFNLIRDLTKGEGWIDRYSKGTFNVTAKGFVHFEKIGRKILNKVQGFVAMAYKPEIKQTKLFYDGIKVGIEKAGYKPLRIDKKDDFNNKICDEIVAEIKRSKFLVADYTGQNKGVYYEAGFAHGLGIPVFFTCDAKEEEKIHFDTRQYVCIFWENLEELAKKLQLRIEGVLGDGPNKI